jgi:hypothetical protein
MAAITLTPQDGGASVVVNTNIIYRVFSYNGGSRVMYGKGGAIPYIMDVTQTPATIVAASAELILVTTTDGSEYLYAGNSANGDGKGIMMINANGSGSIIFFKYTEEAAPIYIYSTDSPSVLAGRINTNLPNTDFVPVSQTVNIGTSVTCNAYKGMITTQTATTGGGVVSSFSVSNSYVTSSSIVRAFIQSYSGTYGTGLPLVYATPGSSAITITIGNADAQALNGTLKIGFEILG